MRARVGLLCTQKCIHFAGTGKPPRAVGRIIVEIARARSRHATVTSAMGHLSTHVLDTMHGCPAAGMRARLLRVNGHDVHQLASFALNADGRHAGGPLLDAQAMAVGRYRLVFEVAAYFRARGVALPEPPFIDEVQVDFGIADAAGHYHVPLLVSPWSYSTYRGS